MSNPTPGFYEDGSGRRRWWDGAQWGDQYEAAPVAVAEPPKQERRANGMPVSYTRQQKGHSLTLHILLIFVFVGLVTVPYYSISPNHYWHA